MAYPERHYYTILAMHQFGGSFIKQLAELCETADPINYGKIRLTWPEYFSEYERMAHEKYDLEYSQTCPNCEKTAFYYIDRPYHVTPIDTSLIYTDPDKPEPRQAACQHCEHPIPYAMPQFLKVAPRGEKNNAQPNENSTRPDGPTS